MSRGAAGGELVNFFKESTPPGYWYNSSNNECGAPYLYEALDLDNVSEEIFREWVLHEHITASHVSGTNDIYVRKYSKKLYVAHGDIPKYDPQAASANPIPNKKRRSAKAIAVAPMVPETVRLKARNKLERKRKSTGNIQARSSIQISSSSTNLQSTSLPNAPAPIPPLSPKVLTQTGITQTPATVASAGSSYCTQPTFVSPFPAAVSSVQSPGYPVMTPTPMVLESNAGTSTGATPCSTKEAVAFFTSGRAPAIINIGGFEVEVKFPDAGGSLDPLCEISQTLLSLFLRRYEHNNTDPNGAIKLRSNPCKPGGTPRVYKRLIGSYGGDLKPKQQKRQAEDLQQTLAVTTNGNQNTVASTVGRVLRNEEQLIRNVLPYTRVSLHGKMTPAKAASMIEGCGMNATQYMKVRLWLEAEFPLFRRSLPSRQAIKTLTSDHASSITMETGTMELHSKKKHTTMKEVAYVRAVSFSQALLVIAHESFLAGKRPLPGAPKGEIHAQDSADAGGSRNNYNVKFIMQNSRSHVQSIREITTLCMYVATGTADDFANHKIAFWDAFAEDRNRLAYGTVVCRVELAGIYIASFFLTDYTPVPFKPLMMVSEIETPMFTHLKEKEQTWHAPAGGFLVMLTTPGQKGIVGIASVDLPIAIGGIYEYLWGTNAAPTGSAAVLGDKIEVNRTLSVVFREGILGLKIRGVFIFPKPVPLTDRDVQIAFHKGAFDIYLDKLRIFAGGDGKYIVTCVNGCTGSGTCPCQQCEMKTVDFVYNYPAFVLENGAPVERSNGRLCEQAGAFQRDVALHENGLLKKMPETKDYGSCKHTPEIRVEPEDRCLTPLHYELKVNAMLYAEIMKVCQAADGQSEEYNTRVQERDGLASLQVEVTEMLKVLEKTTVPEIKKGVEAASTKARGHFKTAAGTLRKQWNGKTRDACNKQLSAMADGPVKTEGSSILQDYDDAVSALKENEAEVLAFRGHLKTLEEALKDANEVMKDTEGPCETALRGALSNPSSRGGLGVDLKKYHGGGTMVGGDGQKVCKRTDAVGSAEERERVGFANRTYGFDVLFAAVRGALQLKVLAHEVTDQAAQEAESKMTKLRDMYAKWAEIQRVMRISSRYLTEEEIVFLEEKPVAFISLVRAYMGIGKSKKLHEIEAHLGKFARSNRTVYLLGEQGAESKHAEMNRRNRVLCRIQDEKLRLKLMSDQERFANSNVAYESASAANELEASRKRGAYGPRSQP